MSAGTYSTRYQRLTFTPTEDTSTGQKVPAWVASGSYLWGSLDETNGRRSQNYGATETGSDAEIRIRNYPTLAVNDILEDTSFFFKYVVDQIRYGDNELICDVHRYDVLDQTGGV